MKKNESRRWEAEGFHSNFNRCVTGSWAICAISEAQWGPMSINVDPKPSVCTWKYKEPNASSQAGLSDWLCLKARLEARPSLHNDSGREPRSGAA